MSSISLTKLLKAGVHLGHKKNNWNPKMFPYIYNEKNNVYILDLVQSAILLNKANKYLKVAASQKKVVLFIGTSFKIAGIIEEQAKRCNSSYINYKWLGGMLTNWKTIKKRIQRLKNLEQQKINLLTKKQAALCRKELQKLHKYLSGIKNLTRVPDVVILLDQKREIMAIQECQKLKIPIISIVDTNCDPDLIDMPIPGNDDSLQSIKLILMSLTNSIISGQLSS